jgi:hypothetical protein
MMNSVKTRAKTPFENFTKAMDGLMRVPHSAIKAALDQEKRDKERKKRAKNRPAPSATSDRASGSED